MGTLYENCKTPKTSTNECLECDEGYELIEGQCYEKEDFHIGQCQTDL